MTARARIPEPMVMDDAESVAAFHSEHSVLHTPAYERNAAVLDALLPRGGALLDLGSGTGRLLMALARRRPDARIVGTDLAERMVATGRRELAAAGLDGRVELRVADITRLDGATPEHFDVVSCVWALHHLPERDDVLRCLREVAALRAGHGAAVWIFDFARLPDAATFPALLRSVPDVPERLLADGIASEAAAWTSEELGVLLADSGLGDAEPAHAGAPFLQAWRLPAAGR